MAQQPPQQAQLQQDAYTALTTCFNAHPNKVLEIEILPPSHEPTNALILQDGTCIGVPKKVLVLAFLHARALFFATKAAGSPSSHLLDEGPERKAIETTRVILLFDPEHLTAANYRKRYLLSVPEGKQRYAHARAELYFLDSILTSPLHRQSKSPTLWALRAHVLEYLLPPVDAGVAPSTEFHDAPLDVHELMERELGAVCKSGERHPKNYYAWQYARRLVSGVEVRMSNDTDTWSALVKQSVDTVKRWCCVHPSDISGWMFLAWLFRYAGVETKGEVLRGVVEYAVSVQLGNESLWVFVRMVVADGGVARGDVEEVMGRLAQLGGKDVEGEEVPLFAQRVSQTRAWVERYR